MTEDTKSSEEILKAWVAATTENLAKGAQAADATNAKISELEERILKLEDLIISQQAQLAALDYLTLPKDKVGKFVDELQDKMYRLSKEVTDKLKPKDE